ncbi:MAG: hypothetical protein L0219_01845 [Phycisphaerales bacterium]|nr:hypothetical protein [Phycisphaerales bacterium]
MGALFFILGVVAVLGLLLRHATLVISCAVVALVSVAFFPPWTTEREEHQTIFVRAFLFDDPGWSQQRRVMHDLYVVINESENIAYDRMAAELASVGVVSCALVWSALQRKPKA